MARRKQLQTSAEITAEIRRLEAERRRVIEAEDQRRGALVREYLEGKNGSTLRAALRPIVSPRDAFLFGLADGGSPTA